MSAHRLEYLAQLRLALPILGGQLAQTANGFVDTMMAGRVGAEDLAAKSGKVLLTCELGAEYDFVDASGERPVDGMGVRGMLNEGFKYPLAGGALGDHTQSNNEGMKAVFHGY